MRQQPMITTVIILLCAALSNGCAKSIIINPEKVYLITPGQTTSQEMIKEFGEPTKEKIMDNYTVRTWKATKMIKKVLIYHARRNAIYFPPNVLSIFFNTHNVVLDYFLNPVGDYTPNLNQHQDAVANPMVEGESMEKEPISHSNTFFNNFSKSAFFFPETNQNKFEKQIEISKIELGKTPITTLIKDYGPPTRYGYQNGTKTYIWIKFELDSLGHYKMLKLQRNKWYKEIIYVISVNSDNTVVDINVHQEPKEKEKRAIIYAR